MKSFDWTVTDCPSDAVVDAVSESAGVGPTDIDPLYQSLDPDALDAILSRIGRLHVPSEASVAFSFNGYRVVVKANGRGYVYDGTEPVSTGFVPQ